MAGFGPIRLKLGWPPSLTELSPRQSDEVQRPNKKLEFAMLNVTLNSCDSLEAVLPTVELAMHTGAVCSIHNINYLGRLQLVALTLLAMSGSVMDSASGQVFQAHPGFQLLGIDEFGVTHAMVM